MKKTFTTAFLAMTIGMVWGQNTTPTVHERLDRGVVALPAQDKGIFVSWRLLGDDANDVTFDVVRNGKTIVEPAAGKPYLDRQREYKYKITRGDLCCRLFRKYGFRWGGDWKTMKDYQHFEK